MDLITSLIRTSEEGVSKIVVIMNQVSNTSYYVKDRKNRKYLAEAADVFLPGQSVVIKNGVIIGRTKSSQTYKEFSI